MTVETNLRAAMAEAVAPTIADTDHLVSVARRRGLGIRRRRQALGSVGVAAALGLVLLGPALVAGDHGAHTARPVLVGTQPSAFDVNDTSPFTGRSTAAALVYAVGLATPGTATDFRGQGDGRTSTDAETYGVFRFRPSGSATAGEVGINVQPHWVGANLKSGGTAPVGRCESFMEHCISTVLADGSRLTTYEDPSSYSSGVRRVAELYRPDKVRIVASASNGYDVTERDEQITRAEPVLTTAQLTAIVTQPWWGPDLPATFATQGDALSPYTDLGDPATAAVSPTPAKS